MPIGRRFSPRFRWRRQKSLPYGGVVSAAEYERACNDYAARLAHVEQAADDLVARLYRDVA